MSETPGDRPHLDCDDHVEMVEQTGGEVEECGNNHQSIVSQSATPVPDSRTTLPGKTGSYRQYDTAAESRVSSARGHKRSQDQVLRHHINLAKRYLKPVSPGEAYKALRGIDFSALVPPNVDSVNNGDWPLDLLVHWVPGTHTLKPRSQLVAYCNAVIGTHFKSTQERGEAIRAFVSSGMAKHQNLAARKALALSRARRSFCRRALTSSTINCEINNGDWPYWLNVTPALLKMSAEQRSAFFDLHIGVHFQSRSARYLAMEHWVNHRAKPYMDAEARREALRVVTDAQLRRLAPICAANTGHAPHMFPYTRAQMHVLPEAAFDYFATFYHQAGEGLQDVWAHAYPATMRWDEPFFAWLGQRGCDTFGSEFPHAMIKNDASRDWVNRMMRVAAKRRQFSAFIGLVAEGAMPDWERNALTVFGREEADHQRRFGDAIKGYRGRL